MSTCTGGWQDACNFGVIEIVSVGHTKECGQISAEDRIYIQNDTYFDKTPPYLVIIRAQNQKITLEYRCNKCSTHIITYGESYDG